MARHRGKTALIHNPEWPLWRKIPYYIPHAVVAGLLVGVVAPNLIEDFGDTTLLTPHHKGEIPAGPSLQEWHKHPNNPFEVNGKKVTIPHDPAYKGANKCPWSPNNPQPLHPTDVNGHTYGALRMDIRCFKYPTSLQGYDADPTNKHFYTYREPEIAPDNSTDLGEPNDHKYYKKALYGACAVKGAATTDTNGVRSDTWYHVFGVAQGGAVGPTVGNVYAPASVFGYGQVEACPPQLQYHPPN